MTAAGGYGWLILLVAAGLVARSVACARKRGPRIVAVTLLLAALLPLGAGLLGLLSGRQMVLHTLEALAAPTEKDFEPGEARQSACLVLGIAAMLVCETAALLALSRAPRPASDGTPPPIPA